jgi:protein O-GlcNAc transferase
MNYRLAFYSSVLRALKNSLRFRGSSNYWDERYAKGGNSGEGSYGELANFKAEFINRFIQEQHILSVIEFGCGDGNQLRLATYPKYTGVDVSIEAINLCRKIFAGDNQKVFCIASEHRGQTAELGLSLDVIYHLVEDEVFGIYMRNLFASASRFVIIYSSNSDSMASYSPHVRHREFSTWVEKNIRGWMLEKVVPNRYPTGLRSSETSFAHFHIFARQAEM